MWNFASNAIAGSLGKKPISKKCCTANPDCSDDDCSSCASREEGLECPICWESFNIVENVPYVLWCGHTMCKNCILGLQWAVIKFPTVPLQLPFFISCPWCNILSFRFVYKGNLTFPRKNYFLLWMVEGMNGERAKSQPSIRGDHHPAWPSSARTTLGSTGYFNQAQRASHAGTSDSNGRRVDLVGNLFNGERIQASFRKSLAFLVHLTAKFPLVIIFLLIVLYAIPASAAVLVLYILVTVLFALPSFLILYFAYPSLDWLVREIFT
uniref:RING-type domain-containing protein n=1 Tax=Ananas comosus var. bracteatus TaxID=296719 RepID=A0A6V7PNX2_ANACO|nr:unnamed protein product [Ananas comosus var. bracteatus]